MRPGDINMAACHVAVVCDADATRSALANMRATMTVADVEERAQAAVRWEEKRRTLFGSRTAVNS